MAKKATLSYKHLLDEIRQRKFRPIYFLQGEESYFIDLITDALVRTVLTPDEKDFNERIVFGADTDVASIINEARYYPSFSDYRLLVVKEAQQLQRIEELVHYARQPLSSTVLVINYKQKRLDGRSALAKEIEKCGCLYDSVKLYDNQLPDWIKGYVQSKGLAAEPDAIQMLAEYIGNDLGRLASEVDKLSLSLEGENRRITLGLIQSNIGISKDYNVFELTKALAQKDFYRANLIAVQLNKNKKSNPLPVTLSTLFNFFSRLLLAHYLPDRSEKNLMGSLGLNFYQAQDYSAALKRYSAAKTMQIIRLIRQTDARFKGFNATSQEEGELLTELIFKIFV
jgi:DNA polymerase III subunit delta